VQAGPLEGAGPFVDADRVLGGEDEGADLHALPPRSGRRCRDLAPRPRGAPGERPPLLSHGCVRPRATGPRPPARLPGSRRDPALTWREALPRMTPSARPAPQDP